MVIKNISGQARLFQFGQFARLVQNNATANVPDSTDAVADAVKWQNQGLLTIQDGPEQAKLDSPASIPGVKFVTLASVISGNTVQLSGTGFSVTFEFNNSTPAAGNIAVALGANTAAAGVNLQTAINANATLALLGVKATSAISTGATNSTLTLAATNATKVAINGVTVTPAGGTITAGSAQAAVVNDTKKVAFRTVVAVSGNNYIVTGLTSVDEFIVQVRDTDGVIQAYAGAITADGGTLLLPSLTAGYTVTIYAYGI